MTGADVTPLAIDLDGTLVRSDLLHEGLVKLAVTHPRTLLLWPGWLIDGKARLKQEIASRVTIDPARLPYQAELLEWIKGERLGGRHITLCTASDERFARAVSDHLGLFDSVMSSDGRINLSASSKAAALVERFGVHGFDYAGNSAADVAVWESARRGITSGASKTVRAAAAKATQVDRNFGVAPGSLHSWAKALRLHQWLKNLLVFLPLLGAHELFELPLLGRALWAFLAFGLCASSVYLLNDMVDIESDRHHPRKRLRPFAAGSLSIPHGIAGMVVLLATAFLIAIGLLPWAFAGWLGVYLVTTLCYTFWLKRKILVDSLVLAGLYTLRVISGSAAVDIEIGFWLLAFSMFLFLSLAMVKRYSELTALRTRGDVGAPGRDYWVEDRSLVETLGVTSGFCSVMVMALYINGESGLRLYPRHQLIWLAIPVLLYWISRLWLKAHRGEMHEDPVVFAITDGLSRVTVAIFFAIMLGASVPR